MPAACARAAAAPNASTMRLMPFLSSTSGTSQPSMCGTSTGPTMRHGSSPRARSSAPSAALPNHGRCMLALRPACASCMPAAAPSERT